MSLPALVLPILIAAGCGAIGRVIAGYSLGGFLVSTGVGFLGAVLVVAIGTLGGGSGR